jgi:hypothetical protein
VGKSKPLIGWLKGHVWPCCTQQLLGPGIIVVDQSLACRAVLWCRTVRTWDVFSGKGAMEALQHQVSSCLHLRLRLLQAPGCWLSQPGCTSQTCCCSAL